MSIKLLVLSDYSNYHSTRPEAQIFIELAKQGFEIFIMTHKNSELKPEFEAVGIRVIEFHPQKKFDKQAVSRIRNTIVENKIDVVHLFNSKAIINGIRATKGLSVKIVLYRGYTGNVHWYDPTAYFKYLHPRVDKIFCNSKGVSEALQNQLFFDKSKTATIYKGHDLEWYKNYKPSDIRTELQIPKDAMLLINVANNRKMKGIPYLLEAINQLPPEVNVHLLLAGKNMDVEENLKIINAGNRKQNIHFLGFRKNVLEIVAACDVFVLPSIKGEGVAKSLIEAMALGVAPVVTDIPGSNEAITNNINGIVVPPGNSKAIHDAILNIYNNRQLCESYGREAKYVIANKLSIKQTVLKTKALYEEVTRKTSK